MRKLLTFIFCNYLVLSCLDNTLFAQENNKFSNLAGSIQKENANPVTSQPKALKPKKQNLTMEEQEKKRHRKIFVKQVSNSERNQRHNIK